MTGDDSYTVSVEALLAARAALLHELVALEPVLHASLELREQGARGLTILQETGGPGVRDRMLEALSAFSGAFSRARAESVRIMIEEDGLTFTEIAMHTGRKRQLISKLYHELEARSSGAAEADADADADADGE